MCETLAARECPPAWLSRVEAAARTWAVAVAVRSEMERCGEAPAAEAHPGTTWAASEVPVMAAAA